MNAGVDVIRVFHLIKSLGRGGAEVLLAEGLTVADRERFEYSYGYFLPWKQAVVPALERQGAEAKQVHAARPDVLLFLAADGEERPKLEEFARWARRSTP
jgi:hypothetical protein